MSTSWATDDYGTFNLRPGGDAEGMHIWIQGRRPYCDRGHWEWGYTGGRPRIAEGHEMITPSYYFMRFETAVAEIEAWLGGLVGGSSKHAEDMAGYAGSFQQINGAARGWAWQREEDGLIASTENNVQLRISFIEQPQPHYILTAKGIESLDDSDRFPRHFLMLENAIQESEDFLAWRLLEVPAEHPGPIDLPPRPVTPVLEKAISGGKVSRKPRATP